VAVWGVGLVVVVVAGLAGGAVSGEADPSPSSTRPAEASAVAPVAGATSSIDPLTSVIFLDAPATTDQVITTAALVVRGDLRVGIARLQVLLQSRSAEPIVVRTIDSLSVDWRRDPRRIPFVVTLPLPDPRPSGPVVVQLVAYDASGRARGVFLRRVQVGARIDPTYGDGSSRPPTGEDGLMGGITSGTNFSWVADGR
jgi:hypothetical protein